MTTLDALADVSVLAALGQQFADASADLRLRGIDVPETDASAGDSASIDASLPVPAGPVPLVSEKEIEDAFDTDEDEVEGDSDEEREHDEHADGEVKTSDRWQDDVPAHTVFVCPHPKCPTNKKPSQHQFKKRKEHPTPEPERKTEWGRYLFKFKAEHPQLDSHTAKVEARKAYVPASGKKKSFQRIFAEKWKANNPLWREIKDAKEVDKRIREAFLAQV